MTFQDFSTRTDSLAVFLSVNLEELPARIGVSRGMFYAYRSGKSPISAKAWRKLEQAERSAGIATPLAEQVQAAKAQGSATMQRGLRGVTAEEILGTYSPADQLKLVQAVQERVEMLLNQLIVDSCYLAETASIFLKDPTNKRIAEDLETLVFEVRTNAEFLKNIRGL